MHRGDLSVLRHAGLHPHQRRMAPAVAVEHLFARERDLHRAPRHHRELRDGDLVAERIALAAEAAAVRRGDDADAGGRELEHLRQRAVHVVRCLGAAPQGELAVGGPLRHGRMLLHRQVGVALVEEQILAHQVGPREARLHVAELEVNEFVEVAAVAVIVDAGLGVGDGVLGVGDGAQRLVLDGNEVERRGCDVFVDGRHGRHRIADESDLVRRERVLVLAHREDTEGDGEVLPRQHGFHAREARRLGRVDAQDLRVRMRAAQQFGVEHPGEKQVVGEDGGARDLGGRVDLAERLADDTTEGRNDGRGMRRRVLRPPSALPSFRRLFIGAHTASPAPVSRPHPAGAPPPTRRPRRS